MVVSQRPSEVDESILSQCGTIFALRLTNLVDRERIKGTLPATPHRPKSLDPEVSKNWALERKLKEGYDRMVASWRAQDSLTVVKESSTEQSAITNNEENE